jgi:hypothetical protein
MKAEFEAIVHPVLMGLNPVRGLHVCPTSNPSKASLTELYHSNRLRVVGPVAVCL